jgi:uncharacterized membrane protein YfcA
VRNAGHIAWREQLFLIPFMTVGVAGGLLLLTSIPSVVLARTLGAFVLLYAAYQWMPLPALRGSRMWAAVCGILGGLVGTVFGTGGPFYAIYLNLRTRDKAVFRATFATNFLIDGGLRLVAYAMMGLLGWRTLLSLLTALPVAGAALYLGGRLHTGLSQTAFVRLISLLLAGSGLALLLGR